MSTKYPNNKIIADMHIHSCLSPCASLDMSPKTIVEHAAEAGMNAVVVADHNSALNSEAVAYECRQAGLACIFGFEANTQEEAHVLCIFDEISPAMELSNMLYDKLIPIVVDPYRYGQQVAVDKDEKVFEMPEKLLSAPTTLTISELNDEVSKKDGLFIPSHIDRPYYSIVSQLGFLPPKQPYSAVEVSKFCFHVKAKEISGEYTYITNSDAHNVDDISLAYTEYQADEFSVKALKKAMDAGRVQPCFECDIRSDLYER